MNSILEATKRDGGIGNWRAQGTWQQLQRLEGTAALLAQPLLPGMAELSRTQEPDGCSAHVRPAPTCSRHWHAAGTHVRLAPTWREHDEVALPLAVLLDLLVARLKGKAAHREGVGEGPAQQGAARPAALPQLQGLAAQPSVHIMFRNSRVPGVRC